MTGQPNWSHGYPVGSIYPSAWHSFQSPAHVAAISRLCGVRWDVDSDTPLSIAEIGCGTGYTACVLAAGNPQATVLGIDYNPAHIAEARHMAAQAGLANARFLEADLAEMDNREIDTLPEFDLITVHGVWSWVSDAVRQGILRIIGRRLKAGGIVLVSYNALPGAGSAMGLARLVQGKLKNSADAMDGLKAARTAVARLQEAKAPHLMPSAWSNHFSVNALDSSDHYILHEFLTEHWRPCFFADVAEAMAGVRCDYAGSATIDENFPTLSLDPAQLTLWEEATSQAERELVFDLCVRRTFRRDIFVRGLRHVDRESAIDGIVLAAATHSKGDLLLATQAGVASLPSEGVAEARAALERGPHSIADLRRLPGCGRMTAAEMLVVLQGSGAAVPLWQQPGTSPGWDEAQETARRFNAVAAQQLAPYGVGRRTMGLASPALGGGLSAGALELAVATRLAARPDGVAAEPMEICEEMLPPGPRPEAAVLDGLCEKVAEIMRNYAGVWKALGIC